MDRYRVASRAEPSLQQAWDEYLAQHVAQVVLAGGFCGASVLETEDGRACEYDAPEGTLDRYVAEHAPALRADSEQKFPSGIQRSRSEQPLRLRVSAPFDWRSLGLVDAQGQPVPAPSNGPFTLAYFAPWCGDCVEGFDPLVSLVRSRGDRAALVGVYAPAQEVDAFARERGGPGAWCEPSERSDEARLRTFHAVLRQMSGDTRRWGLPAVHELWVEDGRFVVRWS